MSNHTRHTDSEEIESDYPVIELTTELIYDAVNRAKSIIVLGEDNQKHEATVSFWRSESGKEIFSLEWKENNEDFGIDCGCSDYYPLEVVVPHKEYILHWYPGETVRFYL